jgi:hypothetical protein
VRNLRKGSEEGENRIVKLEPGTNFGFRYGRVNRYIKVSFFAVNGMFLSNILSACTTWPSAVTISFHSFSSLFINRKLSLKYLHTQILT